MAPQQKISFRKKLLFASITTVVFFLVVELVLFTFGGYSQAGYDDPYVGFSSYFPLFVERQEGVGSPSMVTASNKLRWFNEQRFLREKPEDGFRIFCLGGSTTYGRPYDDRTSFCGWLREFLPVADSTRSWEVVNGGGISYASYRAAKLMEELIDYDPDLFILYTGHNEFLEARSYEHLQEMPSSVRNLGGLLSHTRTYAAIAWILDRARGRSKTADVDREGDLLPGEVKTLLDNAIGPDVYTRDDQLRQQILAHYEFNLRRMVDLARSCGAEVILVTPASNLMDCTPFKSEHRSDLSVADGERWRELYDRGKEAYSAERWKDALEAFDEALEIDDRYAELHYLRGRVLAQLGRYEEAKAALVQARDEDVCPLRALSEMHDIVLRVADELDVPVVDFVGELERLAPHAVPGKEQFLDHVHPTVDVHRELALRLLDELVDAELVSLSASWNEASIQAVTQRIEARIDRKMQAKALRNLSKVLNWAGKAEEADRLALEAVQLVDDDFEAHYQAGNAMLRQGKVDEAIDRYERALGLEPNSALTHYGLALAWTEKGALEKVVAHYERAIELNPDFGDAHYNLGNLHFNHGNLERAAEHFGEAIRCNPQDSDGYNNLGLVLANQGKIAAAKAQFEEAVRTNPRSGSAHANLGRAMEELGEVEGAIRHYGEALQIQPDHAEAAARLNSLLGRNR